jgi:hypothetical protein
MLRKSPSVNFKLDLSANVSIMTLRIKAEHCYAECHYAECRYAECHNAECRYAECHYAECH